MVNRGDRPRRVRVSVHGSGNPYSVHPAVMGQLIVLSDPGQEEGAVAQRVRENPGGQRQESKGTRSQEKREQRSGDGIEMGGGVKTDERERERE